jgi:hypothetical protein
LKKYPFKGTGKISKLFDMILWGYVQASGVSYPLNKFLRGIIPLGKNSFGVSDLSKQISSGYHTPVNKFLRGIIPLRTNFRGVSELSA